MGLELLARSAIAKVSPTLLAEPERDHQNLLHALNLGGLKTQRKSITTIQVLSLCQTLIIEFTDAEFKVASAIINRRNEELHSGGAAFEEYPTQQWISGFYKCCKILCEFQNETLKSLLGEEIEKEAETILAAVAEEVIGKTKSLIAAHKKVFEGKESSEKISLKEIAYNNSEELASKGHHRVDCPACDCTATILGEPYGKANVEHTEDGIVVRQSILPTKFVCLACGLKLNGYNSLSAASIGNHYNRRITYSPEDYYDLINPEDYDAIKERYDEFSPDYDEWNNE